MGEAGWAVIGATVAGLFAFLLDYRKNKHKEKLETSEDERKTRADALASLQTLNNLLTARVDHLMAEHLRLLEAQNELRLLHVGCEKREIELKADIARLENSVHRLQARTGDTIPPAAALTIIADLDGTMLNVSEGCGVVLGYRPQELIRKNVGMLVPPRLQDQHTQALKKVRDSGAVPWPEKVLPTWALKSDGSEAAVTVRLFGWCDARGAWFVTAEVKPRTVEIVRNGDS